MGTPETAAQSAVAAVARRPGGPEVLEVGPVLRPVPAEGQVLVEVEAAGVANADVFVRRGLYPGAPSPPVTPGYDLVGRVLACGPGVTDPAPGTRIAALTVTGAYATHALADVRLTAVVPEELDAAHACALILNYVTAHQMLHRVARAQRGDTVLVWGAAGGVGTALLELCREAGIGVIGTASGARTALVEELGGTALDRRAVDVAAEVTRLAPGGVAATFDPVGGPHLGVSRRLTARSGTLVSYGASFIADRGLGKVGGFTRHGLAVVRSMALPGVRTRFYVIAGRGSFNARHPGAFRPDLEQLLAQLAAGRLAPRVTTLPLDEVQEAHRRFESGTVEGKLVLLPGGGAS